MATLEEILRTEVELEALARDIAREQDVGRPSPHKEIEAGHFFFALLGLTTSNASRQR